MREFEEFVQIEYDRLVSEAGDDGIKLADVLDRLDAIVSQAINDKAVEEPGNRPAIEECVRHLDNQRRNCFGEDLRVALDAINGDTILGLEDPLLRQARPLGNGLRKALGRWNIEDIDASVSARRRNMSGVVAKFEEFASSADQLKAAIRADDAKVVDDLFMEDE